MNANEKEFLVQKIRTQYTEQVHTELDELRELDRQVRRPVNVFSYVLGSVAAVIMGCGMSLVMTDIGSTLGIASPLVPGIIIGVVGLAAAVINYPLHHRLMSARKQKYAPRIMSLSDKLMNK